MNHLLNREKPSFDGHENLILRKRRKRARHASDIAFVGKTGPIHIRIDLQCIGIHSATHTAGCSDQTALHDSNEIKGRERRIGENDTFSKLYIFRQEHQISMTKVSNESSEHYNSSRYQFFDAKFCLNTEKCEFLKLKIFLSTHLLTSSDHSEK